MKIKIFAVLIFGMCIGSIRAEVAYSVEWLKSGCLGFSKYDNKSKGLSEKEADDAMQLGVWLQGYLQAVEMLSYSSGGSIKMVPKEWLNSIPASKSLLAYLNEFEQKHKMRIPDAFEAKSFVNLWYDVKHPQGKPIEAYAYEQLFLRFHFPEAFNAESKSAKGKEEIGESVQIEINRRKITAVPQPGHDPP